MWRWSYSALKILPLFSVFSTYVEVILMSQSTLVIVICILHVCGGDPIVRPPTNISELYSPRMWRWSLSLQSRASQKCVFSTYVEVILALLLARTPHWSILHVCGGDPQHICKCSDKAWYSPRMWRWSWSIHAKRLWSAVFSTYVEVIL